ncbi:hypothetical protein [Caldisericum exile]|uniref:Uncharacterized protein n=1 Tax=Caldisericum exile (strain DSM 21853 / NBRC 104410 / AZM16c01) TaxID=511051 RepID=A0A7U6JFY2_CALEA|nr:hypothetical protein [Caldisericum exile]BAL80750.1 hypothetical protein CSE_06240 [Caldisericum exile AZM16c01]
MKNKNKKQVKKISKFQLFIIFSVILILVFAGLIIYRLFFIKQIVFSEKTIKTLQEPPTTAVSYQNGVLIGNSQGYVALFDAEGNTKFSKKIDDKIFGLVVNPKDGSICVAGVKFHLLDRNFKELYSLGFDNFIPRDPYVAFLNNGNTKLLFQSLKDLSYLIVTVDSNGRILTKDTVPDMGQNSQISIDASGNAIFVLESGDIYLLDGSRIAAKTSITEKQTSSISNVFGYFAGGNIVVGYKTLITTDQSQNSRNINVTLPVYFYNNSLSMLTKTSFDSSINNVFVGNNRVVFSAASGFYFYDTRGNLLNSVPKVDFTPFEYLEGSQVRAYVYKNINQQGTVFYQVIVKDSSDREIGRFIKAFSIDNPVFLVSSNSQNVYIIEGVDIKLLTR